MMKRLYGVSAVYTVCFLAYLMHTYDNPYSFLSGSDVVGLRDRVVWCLMFFPVWGLGLSLFDNNWKEAKITVYRYHSILKWWNKAGIRLFLFVLSSYLLLCSGIAFSVSEDLTCEKMEILGWLMLHAVLLLLVGLLLGLLIRDTRYVGAALILIELGIGCDMNLVDRHIFMMLEAILFVGLFFLFPDSRKKIMMRKLEYEKDDRA